MASIQMGVFLMNSVIAMTGEFLAHLRGTLALASALVKVCLKE